MATAAHQAAAAFKQLLDLGVFILMRYVKKKKKKKKREKGKGKKEQSCVSKKNATCKI